MIFFYAIVKKIPIKRGISLVLCKGAVRSGFFMELRLLTLTETDPGGKKKVFRLSRFYESAIFMCHIDMSGGKFKTTTFIFD